VPGAARSGRESELADMLGGVHPRRYNPAGFRGPSAAWAQWAQIAPDVGIQTQSVLGGLKDRTASANRAASRQVHESTGRSAGNGSLMRTVPLVLANFAATTVRRSG
jgi:ADP-ribosylglycohydrolase